VTVIDRSRIGLALAGAGGMGRRYLRGMAEARGLDTRLCPPFDLVLIADPDTDRAHALAAEAEQLFGRRPEVSASVGNATGVGQWIDAVIIASRTDSHCRLGVAALDNGRHVLVEKPLAVTTADCAAMLHAAGEAGAVLAVAENVRREPVLRLGRAAVAAGLIGEVRFVLEQDFRGADLVQLTPWRHQRESGGILLDLGVHVADVLEYLVGSISRIVAVTRVDEPVRRHAMRPDVPAAAFYDPVLTGGAVSDARYPASAPDVLVTLLEFQGGGLGQWTCHQAAHGAWDRRRIIYGSAGSIDLPADRSGGHLSMALDDGRRLSDVEVAAALPGWRLSPVEAALWAGPNATRSDPDFATTDRKLIAAELADFLEAVEGLHPPEVDGTMGAHSVEILLAAQRSSASGAWVAVS
jgi:predicted dehydrogenase